MMRNRQAILIGVAILVVALGLVTAGAVLAGTPPNPTCNPALMGSQDHASMMNSEAHQQMMGAYDHGAMMDGAVGTGMMRGWGNGGTQQSTAQPTPSPVR